MVGVADLFGFHPSVTQTRKKQMKEQVSRQNVSRQCRATYDQKLTVITIMFYDDKAQQPVWN